MINHSIFNVKTTKINCREFQIFQRLAQTQMRLLNNKRFGLSVNVCVRIFVLVSRLELPCFLVTFASRQDENRKISNVGPEVWPPNAILLHRQNPGPGPTTLWISAGKLRALVPPTFPQPCMSRSCQCIYGDTLLQLGEHAGSQLGQRHVHAKRQAIMTAVIVTSGDATAEDLHTASRMQQMSAGCVALSQTAEPTDC